MLRRWYWSLLGSLFFRVSFHNWYGVRRVLLGFAGARVSSSFRARPTCLIIHPWGLVAGRETAVGDRAVLDCTNGITLGDFVTISQHSVLWTTPSPDTRGGPIRVENDGWVSTDAFVGPGVVVGEGAVLGARAAARESLQPWTIYGGDPARALKAREKPRDLY